jgi:O-antigen biosynthesis protein
MFLVDVLRPGILVELGTHWGNSYCAFCQAIDTWKGDDQSGRYGPEVLADLRAHHDPLYGNFSMLVESTFDAALEHFADASIDLLHVDGLHTYAAVKHDVEAWWPKLSDRGVLVLHDINARRLDYGVWRLWEELRDVYPHLELHHAHGLGVLAVGDEQPTEFRELLASSPEEQQCWRELFFALGYRLRLQLHVEDARQRRSDLIRELAEEKRAAEIVSRRHARELEQVHREQEDQAAALRASSDRVQAKLAALRGRRLVRLSLRLDALRARRHRRADDVSGVSREHRPTEGSEIR